MNLARILFLAVLAVVFVTSVSAKKKAADPKECEVCKKVLGEVKDKVGKTKDLNEIEDAIDSFCAKAKHPKDKKLCYYITPIKREVSRPMSNGVPADRICKRLKRSGPEICEVQYPMKMDASVDVSKLRVKQLKKILADHGMDCRNCLEKSDYVKKVQSLQEHSEL